MVLQSKMWESRSLPTLKPKPRSVKWRTGFFCKYTPAGTLFSLPACYNQLSNFLLPYRWTMPGTSQAIIALYTSLIPPGGTPEARGLKISGLWESNVWRSKETPALCQVGSMPYSTLLRWKYQFQVNVMNLNLVRKIFNFMKSVAFCKSFIIFTML